MRVKPRKGVKVRDPVSLRHVPEEGADVPEGDSYWQRRLLDGDLVLVEADTEVRAAELEDRKG